MTKISFVEFSKPQPIPGCTMPQRRVTAGAQLETYGPRGDHEERKCPEITIDGPYLVIGKRLYVIANVVDHFELAV